jgi:alpha-N-arabinofuranosidase
VVYNEEDKTITVFLLNLQNEDMKVDLSMRSFGKVSMMERLCMSHSELNLENTFEAPEQTAPFSLPCEKGIFEECTINLPKTSWNVLRFHVE